jgi:hypothetical protein
MQARFTAAMPGFSRRLAFVLERSRIVRQFLQAAAQAWMPGATKAGTVTTCPAPKP